MSMIDEKEYLFRILQNFPEDVRDRLREIEFDLAGRNIETYMCPLACALVLMGKETVESGPTGPTAAMFTQRFKPNATGLDYDQVFYAAHDFIAYYELHDWKKFL